jgi:hypothetical protein
MKILFPWQNNFQMILIKHTGYDIRLNDRSRARRNTPRAQIVKMCYNQIISTGREREKSE